MIQYYIDLCMYMSLYGTRLHFTFWWVNFPQPYPHLYTNIHFSFVVGLFGRLLVRNTYNVYNIRVYRCIKRVTRMVNRYIVHDECSGKSIPYFWIETIFELSISTQSVSNYWSRRLYFCFRFRVFCLQEVNSLYI